MNRVISAVLTAHRSFSAREESTAQTTAKDLVGTWTLVSITIEQDGKKTDLLGPNLQGQQETRAANGHVSVIITRSDFPQFASNNRAAGTPEENKAAVQGTITYLGMSSVNETDISTAYWSKFENPESNSEKDNL
jgi:hypothetical protein